jgi:hypothetical protein
MEEFLAKWEDDGGALARIVDKRMTGTVNQVAWAEHIRTQVHAEFDRIAKALELAAGKQSSNNRRNTTAMIAILEEKRAEVMAHEQAGYFIHDWQELRDQVRRMITEDSRYIAMKGK